MATALTYLLAGLATGCTFALVATGFVLVYRVTKVVNFAQGIFAVIAGFVAWRLLGSGVPHGLAEIVAVLASALAGLVVGLVAIGRRNTPLMTSLIVTLAMSTGAYAVVVILWGDTPVSFTMLRGLVAVAGATIQPQYLLIMAVTLVTFAALSVFFGRTYVGKGLSACSSNPYAARLMGIDTRLMGLLAFVLGGALGGLAGVLLTPMQPVEFDSDVNIALNGFAAAVFGGILRPGLALVGGLVLGITETFVAGYYKANYQSAIALLLMLAIMVWQASRRPEGQE
jgi:branched-chain amino acid transport system permease protein